MDPFQSYSFPELNSPGGNVEFPLPVRFLGTGRERQVDASYRWDNARHAHRRVHVLQYTTLGRGEFLWREGPTGRTQQVFLGPGDLFIASWDQPFEYRHPGGPEPWEFRWVVIDGPLADQSLARVCRNGPVVRLQPDSPPVLLWENLHRRLALRNRWDRFALSAVAYEWVLCLLKETERGDRSPSDEVEKLAAEWVLGHLAEADCPSMAKRFGYNDKYFAEFLRQHTGLTPQKFITDRKMQYARILLASTARSVGAISEELGFAEDNYFSKVFRQSTGQSPQEYRTTHRESLIYDELVPL